MTMKNRQRLILLVNLGTPDAPTAGAVRRYLAEFLHDYRVVDLSRWLWCILLHFIILPIRSGRVAGNYAKIWLPKGSPLLVYSQGLADKLQHQMPNTEVRLAMRYGNPSIAQELTRLKEQGCDRILLAPLYPQYSGATTASAIDVSGFVLADGRRISIAGNWSSGSAAERDFLRAIHTSAFDLTAPGAAKAWIADVEKHAEARAKRVEAVRKRQEEEAKEAEKQGPPPGEGDEKK